MIRFAPISRYILWCGTVILFCTMNNAFAQQLYSDSVVAAKVKENLCMVLPDTTFIALQEDTSTLYAQSPSLNSMAYFVFNPGCGECMNYSFSSINWASYLVSPISFCCFAPSTTCVAIIQPAPVSLESSIGITASAPVKGNAFGPPSSNAAKSYHEVTCGNTSASLG